MRSFSILSVALMAVLSVSHSQLFAEEVPVLGPNADYLKTLICQRLGSRPGTERNYCKSESVFALVSRSEVENTSTYLLYGKLHGASDVNSICQVRVAPGANNSHTPSVQILGECEQIATR
jgi:hypothetical protein